MDKKLQITSAMFLAALPLTDIHAKQTPRIVQLGKLSDEAAASAVSKMLRSGVITINPETGLMELKPSVLQRLNEKGLLDELAFERSTDTGGWKTSTGAE